jgi:phosphonate degradation associated HDIG domain protein
MEPSRKRLTCWLETVHPAIFVIYATTAAFTAYFCMYAFRKPFAAAQFAGQSFLGTNVSLKTAFVISQIIGYTISKYLGIKICSEATRARRASLLVGMIVAAELALLLFAVLPPNLMFLAIFLNGLPLGMVWGLIVWYLEGRRTSDILLAGLSCSFIVSSGAVKDVGRWLLSPEVGVSENWMPFVTGLLFLPVFLLSVWLLDQLPAPTLADREARVDRQPMNAGRRFEFMRQLLVGLSLLLVVYFFLTAFRDFRDNYAVEIYGELGFDKNPTILTRSELLVGLGVMVAMGLLNLIQDRRLGLIGAYGFMAAGTAVMGVGTLLLDRGSIDGFWWMILVGLGLYLAYVPYNSVLFDRLIAFTGMTGTAVFAIYVADALGYTGSVGVQLYKDLGEAQMSRLNFLRLFSYALSIGGTITLFFSCLFFMSRRWVRSTQLGEMEMPVESIDPEKPIGEIVDRIVKLFQERGDAAYVGEPVSQTEHALQAAWSAEKENAPGHMVAAALLHDVGHLLHKLPEDCADQGIDSRHEELGARWLQKYFGPEVTEPMRLHVAAKRYLCATDPAYLAKLSEASVKSLALQGGPMTSEEVSQFRQNSFAESAVALRLWDEEAKIAKLPTPHLEHFRSYLEAALRAHRSESKPA